VADQVLAVAEFTQTPLDLPGSLALAALATAAGGRAFAEVRPGWREPLNLFVVVAMPPGSRKSAVFAAMTAPLLDAERALVEQAKPRIAQAKLARRVADRDAERKATAAADTIDPEARGHALATAIGAALDADTIQVPALPRLVADDVTPEAAASLLAEHDGRVAVLSAEGGIFATMAGRYTGGIPSLEVCSSRATPETVSMRMQAALLIGCDSPETDAQFAVLGRIGRPGWRRRLHAYGRAA
jgi:replicative DNA helicase